MADIGEGDDPRRVEILPLTHPCYPHGKHPHRLLRPRRSPSPAARRNLPQTTASSRMERTIERLAAARACGRSSGQKPKPGPRGRA